MLPKPLAILIVVAALVAGAVWLYNAKLQSIHDDEFRGTEAGYMLDRDKPKPTVGEEMFQSVTKPILLCAAGVAVVWALVSLGSQPRHIPTTRD